MIAFALQGVCLFLNLVCYIERYSAEVRGSSRMLVTTSVSHPFTYLRWLRMIDKARTKTRERWWNVAVVPQLLTVERCLAMYYQAAVGTVQASTPAAVEWRLQREALETLARYRLVSPHLFIAMRCARVAVRSGRMPNEEEVVAYAEQADHEQRLWAHDNSAIIGRHWRRLPVR